MKDNNFKTGKSGDLKQKKLLTQQLEEENKKMENRLQELRMAMTKEKEERSFGGGYWNKGKPGALLTYKPEELKSSEKNSSRMKKIAMLKDEPPVIPKRPVVPGTMAYIAQHKDIRLPEPAPLSKKFMKCGQCEEKQASVMCQECGEDYCAKCFASFHLRGALKKHRSVPISGVAAFRRASLTDAMNDTEVSTPSTLKADSSREKSPSTYSPNDSPIKTIDQTMQEDSIFKNPSSNGGAHLNGTYDEAEQAREFRRAVMEWRNMDKPAMSTVHENGEVSTECGTSTEASVNLEAASNENILANAIKQIQFKHSLSYAEQLMLKKHRREEQQKSDNSSEVPMFNGVTPRESEKTHLVDSNNHNSAVWMNGISEENSSPLHNGYSTLHDNRDESLQIEEISSELKVSNSKKHKSQKVLKETSNESVRKSPEPSEIVESSAITKRPHSSRLPNTPRSRSGLDYERPVSRAKTRIDCHSQKGILTGKPSLALSEIAALSRAIPDINTNENSWLMLGVDSTDKIPLHNTDQDANRPQSARSTAGKQKLSYKFYQIGPKSWKPDRSLIPDNFEPRSIPEAWSVNNFKNELTDPSAPLSNSEALEEIHRISTMTTPRIDSSHIIEYVTPRRLRSAHGRPLPPKKPKSHIIANRPHSARELSSYKGIIVEGDDMSRFDSLHPGELDEDKANAVELFKELTLGIENMNINLNTKNSCDLFDSLDFDGNESDSDVTVKASVDSPTDFDYNRDEDIDELDTARYQDKEDVESLC